MLLPPLFNLKPLCFDLRNTCRLVYNKINDRNVASPQS